MTEDTHDPRLEAAEMMRRRLVGHPGATPGTRRIAEELVSALRRVVQERRRVEAEATPRTGRREGPAASSTIDALDDLDARAGDLLGALAALHGVIVRRDLGEAARALVEAQRTLSEVAALEDGAEPVDGDDG